MALYHHLFKGAHSNADPHQFGWYSNSGASNTVAQAAAVTWLNNLWVGPGGTNGLGSLVTSAITMSQVTTLELDPATGGQLTRLDTAVSLTGTAAGNSLPPDVALVVTLRSATANRKGRGRFFLPSLAVLSTDASGNVLAASITTLTAALTFAYSGFHATGTTTLYSRTDHLLRTVTSGDVGNRWDTQRHRDNTKTETRTAFTP